MKKIYIESLGCAKNQVDSEVLATLAEDAGYTLTSRPDEADVITGNTCGFIEHAKKEALDTFFSFRNGYPDKKIILAGCLAQRYFDEIELPEADAIFGHDLVSAGDVAAPLEGYRTPRPLTEEEITDVIKNFKAATIRAIKAGFDGVEIHGANNYLIHQFFSPHSNTRTDRWGGSLEKRAAFPLAVVEAVLCAAREAGRKDFIVGYRLSPREQWTPGITLKDTLYLVDKLASLQLDYLHISQSHIGSVATEQGYTEKSILAYINETVNGRLPIISVGNIQTRSDVEEALTNSDMAAVGGSALIDPNWAAKLLNNHDAAIRTKLAPEDCEILKVSPLAYKILASRAPERIL